MAVLATRERAIVGVGSVKDGSPHEARVAAPHFVILTLGWDPSISSSTGSSR
jgi:hypothetical protein